VVQSTTVAKEAIKQYYGKKSTKNYFIGCSTGGRQGSVFPGSTGYSLSNASHPLCRLQLAQQFPDLYDGILAGAPAADWINLMAWEAHVRNLVTPVNGSSWIPGATWGVIHQGQ